MFVVGASGEAAAGGEAGVVVTVGFVDVTFPDISVTGGINATVGLVDATLPDISIMGVLFFGGNPSV